MIGVANFVCFTLKSSSLSNLFEPFEVNEFEIETLSPAYIATPYCLRAKPRAFRRFFSENPRKQPDAKVLKNIMEPSTLCITVR